MKISSLQACWCASLSLLGGLLHVPAAADEVSSAVYLRTDDDHTTIVAPRIRANKQLGAETGFDASYNADIWTSASIDVRASASLRPVTEQRDEVRFGVRHALPDLELRAGYRFSTEPDYVSQGGSLGLRRALASNAAALEASAQLFVDSVGRSGDPDFQRGLTAVDGRLAFMQVLDPISFIVFAYELAHHSGFQASPYRFVGIGTTRYGCIGASLCVSERVPAERTRQAFSVEGRRAMDEELSMALGYRYYIDSWSLRSHTFEGGLGWNVAARAALHLRYRYYWQSAAEFYQRRYLSMPETGLRTRDRELSEFNYQRAGLEFEYSVPLGAGKLTATALSGVTIYDYDDYLGLNEVTALELTAAVLVVL